MIAVDLNKHQALNVNPKAIQQINFTGNLSGNNNRLMFLIVEKWKKLFLIFHKEWSKYCTFILF